MTGSVNKSNAVHPPEHRNQLSEQASDGRSKTLSRADKTKFALVVAAVPPHNTARLSSAPT
eukprot:5673892-Amphidinium_carterae.1